MCQMTKETGQSEAPHRVALQLDSDPQAQALARRALEPLAPVLGPRTYADLRFVVSELVGNSVKHGPGSSIELWIERDEDGRIRGAVTDDGEANIAIREHADPLTGGMGMQIVDALTERWCAETRPARVRFEMSPTQTGQTPLL